MSKSNEQEKRSYILKSKSNNWGTPSTIKNRYDGWFDPCPYPRPIWDGLQTEWKEKNFVNPPYDNIGAWAQKSMEEFKNTFYTTDFSSLHGASTEQIIVLHAICVTPKYTYSCLTQSGQKVSFSFLLFSIRGDFQLFFFPVVIFPF